VFLKNSVQLEETKVKTELKIKALEERQLKAEFYTVTEHESAKGEEVASHVSASLDEDLRNQLDISSRNFNKLNPKRLQAKIISDWL